MLSNRDAVVLLWHNRRRPHRTGGCGRHEVAAAELVRRPPEGMEHRRTVRASSQRLSSLATRTRDAFVVRRSAIEPKLRSSTGASETGRERLIATHDRCRLGAGPRTRASSAARTSYSTPDVTRATRDSPTRRVVFAITAAAERIAVGSART